MVERQADHSGTDAEVTGDAAVSARTDLAADQTPHTDLARRGPRSAAQDACAS